MFNFFFEVKIILTFFKLKVKIKKRKKKLKLKNSLLQNLSNKNKKFEAFDKIFILYILL